MTPPARHRPLEPVRRELLTREEAAAALGIGLTHFSKHVQPFLKVVPVGQLVLIPPRELSRWVSERAQFLVDQDAA